MHPEEVRKNQCLKNEIQIRRKDNVRYFDPAASFIRDKRNLCGYMYIIRIIFAVYMIERCNLCFKLTVINSKYLMHR